MAASSDIVYHYTSHESALGIIRSEELWLTNILYLNDAHEFWGIFELIQRYTRKRSEDGDPIVGDITANIQNFVQRRPGTSICVTCFSTSPDDAAQWHRYAAEGRGVAIGFDVTKLTTAFSAHKYLYAEAIQYDADKILHDIDKIIREVEATILAGNRGNAVNPLIRLAAYAKHSSFSSENEFRVARQGVPYSEYEFFTRDDNLVPFRRFPIQLEFVRDIRLGPKADEESLYAWELMLSQIGNGSVPHGISISKSTSGLK